MAKGKRKRTGKGGAYEIVQKADINLPKNTKQLEEFDNTLDYIVPPYDSGQLIQLVEESDVLKPLINAMATNIALFGYGIRYKQDFDYNKADKGIQKEALEEWVKLDTIYKYFNPLSSFSKVLYKTIYDKETIGYGMIEIIRDMTGNMCGGEYARACNFRIVPQKPKDRVTLIKQVRRYSDGRVEQTKVPRVFKKFVQIINGNKVFFKEFGDPRTMDWRTGEYIEEGEMERAATEIIFLTNHCSYSDYGTPKWSGNIKNIKGSSKSELLNLAFFIQGKILPFAICVENGSLTEDSLEAINEGKGVDNAYKALLLEALPDDDGAKGLEKEKSNVKIDIKSLADTTLKDGLFMEYQKANREKIRADLRIPPIYLGDSTDYNKATAEVSKLIAEEQVFIPEREEVANLFNSIINNELEIEYCEMYLKGPVIGDITEIAAALEPFIKAGTVTPNMLIDTLGQLLGKDIEVTLPDEIGNVPIEIYKLHMQQKEQEQDTNIQKMDNDQVSHILKSLETLVGEEI